MTGFRSFAEREAKRLQAKIRRETIRELRADIKKLRARRRQTLSDVRSHCRSARCRLKDRIAALRLELKREIAEMRAEARARCNARIERVSRAGGTQIEVQRARIREERELAREIRAAEGHLRKRHAERERTRHQESDDEVRSNLPAELVPIFNHIKRSIRSGPRISRTEAFLQWVEENPDEVSSMQFADAELATERMIRELQELEREDARQRGAAA